MAADLPEGWNEKKGRLVCTYEFKDFVRAMTFLNEVAFNAEAQEHHPDFTVHWNQVRFEVWSHDADKITERDHRLVSRIGKIAQRHRAKAA